MALTRRAGLGLGLLTALLPELSVAMFAEMNDAELLQRSTLVVMGDWIGQDSLFVPGATAPMQVGVVSVSEVLKGAPGQALAFVAVPAPNAPRSGSDIHYRKGDLGLWLLRQHPRASSGLYLADSPQRFVPLATGAARIEVLRRALTAR